MKNIYYALYHVYQDKQTGDDKEKFIGLFSRAYKAREAAAKLRDLPGFKQFPKKAFEIYPVEINESSWVDGFETVYYYD